MRLPKGLNLIEHNSLILAKLYHTLIVKFEYLDNGAKIVLSSGGWRTKHTKKCMNLVLNKHGVYIYQKDFEWYINTPTAEKIPFVDGITVNI